MQPRSNLPSVVPSSTFSVPVVYATRHQMPVVYAPPTSVPTDAFVQWNSAPPPQEASISNFEERLSDVFAQGTPPSDPRARPKVVKTI